LPLRARLRFDPAAASRRRLPILKCTAGVAGIFRLSPLRRLRARRALRSYTSKRPKPTRFHRLALADGTFDPGERGPHDRFDHGLRLGGVSGDAFDQVSEKHKNLLLLNDHRAGNTRLPTKQTGIAAPLGYTANDVLGSRMRTRCSSQLAGSGLSSCSSILP
jgi:hypothetical protein